MTEITLKLTKEELKLIDKYIELNDETQGVFEKIKNAYPKSETLYDVIADWWDDTFTKKETSLQELVDAIEDWLPKEQSVAGSQNAYVECSVEGYNDCLKKIKGKLR